jgi:aquaporin Z
MPDPLRSGWPHLLIEAGGAALVLFAACVYATLLNHPASPIPTLLPSPAAQRVLMGLAMGGTVAAFTYSALGRRSGAHLNPAVTLAFLRLGRVPPADAAAYVASQVTGAAIGIATASLALRGLISHPSVDYVTTRPGPQGAAAAAVAELAISAAQVPLGVPECRAARTHGGECQDSSAKSQAPDGPKRTHRMPRHDASTE